ncbi:MAG TPA: DUF1214 domain-containing protein [Rhizomicrobium sp.]|jgi:hypothetical protein
MNIVVKSTVAVAIGILLGLGLTWLAVVKGAMPGGVQDGPWRSSLAIGSANGNALTRARVALHGLLALNRTETLYYTASEDSAGAPLDGACAYALGGRDPDARWWSITAYGPDDYLIPNVAHAYSVSRNSIQRAADGSFRATVSMRPPERGNERNWIALAPGRFTLTLRLYNPGAKIDPVHTPLPSIAKESCS